MKKLVLSFIFIFGIFVVANAQDFGKKGCLEVGGAVSFSTSTAVVNGETADDSRTTFSFMPYAGYFIMDGLELGVNPLGFTSSSFGDNSETSMHLFFAPAYNFLLKGGKIFPFVEGLVGYTSTTVDDGNNDETLSGISYGGRGGVKVQLGKSSLLVAGVSYIMYTENPEDADERFGSNDLAISLGFTVFFGK